MFKNSRNLRNLLNFGLKSRLKSRRLSSNVEKNSYPIHRIEFKTCGTLYKQLKLKNKLYENSPINGLKVNIEYADTYSKDRNNSKPVILGLHGMPGSLKDFTRLIKYFDSKNYRVIVPNFPGFELTRNTKSYWHSAQEKAQLVRDLLNEIGVKEVDALVCHSSGLFPGSYLWSESEKLKVKSVALFNTPYPSWAGKRKLFIHNYFAKLITRNMDRIVFIKPETIAKLLRYPTTGDDNQLLEWPLMYTNSSLSTIDERLKCLKVNRIPTLFLMSEKDNVFKKNVFFDAINVINGYNNDKYNYDVFDGNKTDFKLVSTDVNPESLLQVINIRPAGHFVFIKLSNIVMPYVEKLLIKAIN